MRDLILFWLRTPGFSTARDDSLLVTDTRNSLASQFWEGQLRTALKDGSVRHLFENTDAKYFGKGFEMVQVLEDNFRPSSISNSFTTLLALFNDTQGDKEGLHEFRSRFEGHLGALSRSSVAIPPILQVMLFLRALHARYGDLLTQFASKHKDLSTASIDSVISDAKFMDEFTVVGAGGKPKPGHPSPSPRSPTAASVVTDGDGKRYRTPFEWLASYDPGSLANRWRRSLGGNFYCAFCNGKEKHHPTKCPLLGELGLKLIDVSGGNRGSSSGSTPLAGAQGGTPPAMPPATAPAAVGPPPAPASLQQRIGRMTSTPERFDVVIIGAGFGGLSAAKALKNAPADVTLIDRRNHHLFQPLLYQVATAGLAPNQIATPIRAIVRKQKNANVELGTVEGIEQAALVGAPADDAPPQKVEKDRHEEPDHAQA